MKKSNKKSPISLATVQGLNSMNYGGIVTYDRKKI